MNSIIIIKGIAGYLLLFLCIYIITFLHEFGHLICAKLSNIPVQLFLCGSGPVLLKKQIHTLEFRMCLFPGGYIIPKAENSDIYFQIPLKKRIIFIFGGIISNIILIFLSIFIIVCMYKNSIALSDFRIFADTFLSPQSDETLGFLSLLQRFTQNIQSNVYSFLYIFAYINLNYVIVNLLPIITLDGDKLFFSILERKTPRLLKPYLYISLVMSILISIFIVFLIFIDVKKLFFTG